MTRVTFKRSGNTADPEINVGLDLDSLPAGEAQNLLKLIADANFFNLPEKPAKGSSPDGLQYVVSVEAGQARHTVQVSDEAAPDSIRPLLDELSRIVVLSSEQK